MNQINITNNYYIYGEELGKTSSVRYLYPNLFTPLHTLNIWDGYEFSDGENILFDNMEFSNSIRKHMKGRFDIYTSKQPFEIRESNSYRIITINPKRIFLVSTLHPQEIYIERTYNTINDRFNIIHINDWLEMNNIKFNELTNQIEIR